MNGFFGQPQQGVAQSPDASARPQMGLRDIFSQAPQIDRANPPAWRRGLYSQDSQPAQTLGSLRDLFAQGVPRGAQASPFPPNFGNNTFLNAWSRMNGGQPQMPMAGGNTVLGAFAQTQQPNGTRDRIRQMFLGR